MKDTLTIAISGAAGRMGIALIKALSIHPTLELTAAGIRPGTEAITRSQFEHAGVSFAGELLVEQNAELFARADAIIDFSAPENAVGLAGLAAQHRKILVSGTTGLNAGDLVGQYVDWRESPDGTGRTCGAYAWAGIRY